MKAENSTTDNEMTYLFSELKSYPYNLCFKVSGDSTNCKLSYIHGIGSLTVVKNDNEKLEILNFLLSKCKGCVIINSTSKPIIDLINNNFPSYYNVEVPIGYGSGYQYHICIKNTVKVNPHCREPKKVLKVVPTKEQFETKLRAILKKYKRKDDYVEEFINSL